MNTVIGCSIEHMPTIDANQQTITFVLAYYGPGVAGKYSSIRYIEQRLDCRSKQQLVWKRLETGPYVSFTCAPRHLPLINSLLPQFTLVTRPGAILHEHDRIMLLEEADGIVFVADSQRWKLGENLNHLREMVRALHTYGRSPRNIPTMFQYNKRDLPAHHLASVETLNRYLNPMGWPYIETVASSMGRDHTHPRSGRGVIEGFERITDLVYQKYVY